jgi:lysophospholipase L1-like esterase
VSSPSLTRRLLRDTALAVGILVGLELFVRATGVARGPDPALPDNAVVEEGVGEGPYIEAAGPGLLQTSRTEVAAGRMRDLTFAAEPPAGTLRVLLLGGSVAKGVPIDNDPPRTISGRLQTHLQLQGVQAEVLNLAGSSYTTAHVARVARDAMSAHPDAIVVYSGGNEHRAFTRRLWEQNQGWRGAVRVGHGLHLVRLLARVAAALRRDDRRQEPEDAVHEVIAGQSALVAEVMARVLEDAGPAALPVWGADGVPVRQDPGAVEVARAYRQSLQAVLDAARGARVPPVVLIVKPPANRYTPPQLSMLTPGLSETRKAEFQRHFDAGALAQRSGDCRSAVQQFEAALAIDTLHADAWHQHGKCLLELGDPSQTARRNLAIASELDFAPDRAGRSLYRVVDDLVATSNARTPDLSDDFGPRNDFGRTAFHDHVHLKPTGQDLIARRVADALVPLLRARP